LKNWRGKKRWGWSNIEPVRALLSVESMIDSKHQKALAQGKQGIHLNEREVSQILGLCRSSLECLRRAGIQQTTIPAFVKGTKRPKGGSC